MADSRLEGGLIVTTSASCIVKGQSWPGIPTLVWPDGIDEAASDWFRTLVVERGAATSSAHEYANMLRPFLRFCRSRNRDWRTVDDEFLIVWREQQRRSTGVGVARVNSCLRTIFSFYQWAEESGRTRYQVGVYAPDELPPALIGHRFPISAKRSFSKGRSGRVHGAWTTPLTLAVSGTKSRMRHTPTDEEIRRVHEALVEAKHRERNSLMFAWMEAAGPRRAEIGRILKSHIPTIEHIGDLIDRDEPWSFVVVRKGGAAKPLEGPPDLLLRTSDYINYERREIVDHCLATIVGYREPDEVFISGTTGMPLHPDTVTSLGRLSFQRAGIERASAHRLRARYAVRVIEELLEAIVGDDVRIGSQSSWFETILVKAAEKMGHGSPQSLRPYLTYVLNRRIQTAEATKAGALVGRMRELERSVAAWVQRLRENRSLHEIGGMIAAGRNVEAAAALRQMADGL